MTSFSSVEPSAQKQRHRTGECIVPKRIIVVIMSFLGMFNVLAMRYVMSVVVVAIMGNGNPELENSYQNYTASSNMTDVSPERKNYDWDSKTQGAIMGSFFYGYFFTTLCGGYLAVKFGAKRLFGASVLLTALFTLLSPLSIRWGYVPLIALRSLIGIFEGFAYPSMMVIISRWAPKSERSRILATIMNGHPIGIVVSSAVAGWMSSTPSLGGWPSVFYLFGSLSCIWCICWFVFIYEAPHDHPSITAHELSLFSDLEQKTNKKPKVPWISILKSPPFWAAFAANFGSYFFNVILLTELPTYLSTVLHFNLKESGILSSIPHIAETFGSWISSYVADKLRNTGMLHITTIRKIMNSIAAYGTSAAFIAITLVGDRPNLILIILCCGTFIRGCQHPGFVAIHTDMSSHFSGTTFGLCNGISSLTGIMGPAMVGAFTTNGATASSWAKIFYVTSAIEVLFATVFVIFASAELQPWAKDESSCKNNEKKENC